MAVAEDADTEDVILNDGMAVVEDADADAPTGTAVFRRKLCRSVDTNISNLKIAMFTLTLNFVFDNFNLCCL
jgi:hypothetical protein